MSTYYVSSMIPPDKKLNISFGTFFVYQIYQKVGNYQ